MQEANSTITLRAADYIDALIRVVNSVDNYAYDHGRKKWEEIDRHYAEQEMERNWPRKILANSIDAH